MAVWARSRTEACVRTTTSAPAKSKNRDTAERSVLSALALAMGVAATHFVPGDSSKQPGPVLELQRLVIEARGEDCVPINTAQIVNCDETTLAACANAVGEKRNSTDRYVQLTDGSRKAGHQSDYSDPATRTVKGVGSFQRLKKYTASTGQGAATPPFISVAGLNQHEMPVYQGSDAHEDPGIHVLELHAMRQGAHKDPFLARSTTGTPGQIVFSRASGGKAKVGESPEGQVYALFREKNLYPLMEQVVAANGHVPGSQGRRDPRHAAVRLLGCTRQRRPCPAS